METDKDKDRTQGISVGITVLLIVVVVTLVITLGGSTHWLTTGEYSTERSVISPALLVCNPLWVTLACVVALAFLIVHSWTISRAKRTTTISQTDEAKKKARERRLTLARGIGTVLHKRYPLFWRCKVRLPLVTGDKAAIE